MKIRIIEARKPNGYKAQYRTWFTWPFWFDVPGASNWMTVSGAEAHAITWYNGHIANVQRRRAYRKWKPAVMKEFTLK